MSRILLPAVSLLALAACQLAPPHEIPPLPTPSGYDPAYAPSGDVRATEIGWREFFGDPRLQALIATALENNRDLRIATAQIEEARGLYRIENSARLPTIGVSASGVRSRTPLNAAGVGFGGGGIVPPVDEDSSPNSITFNRFDVGVGISAFELDFWGRVRNLSEAARARYLATVEAQRAFRLSLVADLASTYFAQRETLERIRLAEATVESREEGVRIAERRLEAGITSALDFRQAETLLTQAETELAAQRLALAQTNNLLSVLVGGPIEAPLPDGRSLGDQGLVETLEPGLPSALLVNRPDIIAAEEDLRAARADIGAARAAFFPTISLTGNLGFASDELDNLVGDDNLSWSFGPTISLPIFDWGARQGNLTVAEARENIQLASYERTIQEAFREVSDALAGRRFLAEQVAAQERAVDAQRELARLARLRYREGVANYLEVLDAERNLFSAEQALIQIRRIEQENLVSLYIALGGGLTP